MSQFNLLEELYSLTSQMTVANGYNFEWSSVQSWENGASIIEQQPKLYIEIGEEDNEEIRNGVGNNYRQLIIPVTIKFGKTLEVPSSGLDVTKYQLEELQTKLEKDIKKMYGSQYKIRKANVPEYCGTEYKGVVLLSNTEEDLGAYTVVTSLLFWITYKEPRET